MAYTINATFRVASYTEAKAKYESVKPIRGKDDDVRPLGDRRAQHMRIVKNDDDSYACRLYSTDVATFHKDGRAVFKTGGWGTTSTANFMTSCTPSGWWVSKLNNHIQAYHRQADKYYVVQNGFTINTNTNEVSGYATPTKQVVNREKSKEMREPFKTFLAFAQTFMETLNMEVPHAKETFWENQQLAHKFLRNPSEVSEEMYLNVMTGLVYYSAWSNKQSTFSQLKSKIYRENTVYDTVDLPVGSLQK